MADSRVFISYSHKDQKWLERLRVHLRPLVRDSDMEVWDDTRLQAGDAWRPEIKKAIGAASIAVLLVSADFLASDFVIQEELPALSNAADEGRLRILQLIVGPCRFEHTSLARFQTVNSPADTLLSLNEYEREAVLARVAERIESALREQKIKAEIHSVQTQLDEMSRRVSVSELFLSTMSPAMYTNLHKIVNAPFGSYEMNAGLRRELDHLRTIGYVELESLSKIPKVGQNLSEFVKSTEAGRRFVQLREELNSNKKSTLT